MRTVYVVPHCHWDREWYQPFELFRWRLVQMIDELLDHMEAHPEYRCFNLDGQTIVVEDYLELRPENEGRLKRLIAEGRIVIGPWLVQPDEFLPSGESHIRSFLRGMRFAERLGGYLNVGHCADQFGHIAQMPQIMSQLGLSSACLWRGVPDSVPGWSFQWQAPDGTRLPVLYLRNSYSSGWRLPSDPEELAEWARRQVDGRRPEEPALLMNGTDHSRMEQHVPGVLGAAAGRGYDFRMATLAEYERAQLTAGIDEAVHVGELRSPDQSNVLAGVLSARMHLKQRDFAVSSLLERIAEPLELLSFLHGGPDGAPALRRAWRLALENTPHDSICGCSVDQVHREMLPRYDGAEQLARQVAREAMAHIVAGLEVPPGAGIAVFRPVPHAAAVLECDVPADWRADGLRLPDGTIVPVELGEATEDETLYEADVSPRGARRHLDFIREGRYDVHAVEAMSATLEGVHLRVETTAGEALNSVDDGAVRDEVGRIVSAGLAESASVAVRRSGTGRLRALLPASDAVGVLVALPARLSEDFEGNCRSGRTWISDGRFELRLRRRQLEMRDAATGFFVCNLNAFVSEGDRGDEYNAEILPDAVIEPAAVEVLATEHGPGHARLTYATVLDVPAGLARSRKRRAVRRRAAVVAVTEVTLRAGLDRVDFRVVVGNGAKDHRLRALFPLPFRAECAITENTFHVSERALEPPPWNGESAERPPTTFPQKTFAALEADGRGLAVFNRGLPEGEVVRDVQGRQAYALTLLRCVGWLSRDDLAVRRGGAGPKIATPDAQMPGTHEFAYALTCYSGSWRDARVQPMAQAFAHPPLAFATNGHGGEPALERVLARFRDAATVPSGMLRSEADGAPLVRVYSAAQRTGVHRIEVPTGSRGASRTDLQEATVEALEHDGGGWGMALRPWEIGTVRFGR